MAVATPPDNATNEQLICWSFDALNRHDLDALRRFWTADTVERFPDRTCHGTEEIAAYFKEAFAALEGFHMDVVCVAAQGDDVFVHWHLTGRHIGPVLGIEPTGKDVAIDGMDHFVLRNGTVVTNFVVFDQMQYARQVGMIPPDGSTADRAMKAAFNAKTKLRRRRAR
jgi:predicted ester cyclase